MPGGSNRVTISRYPLHIKNQLMTYNLYAEDPVNGVTDSLILHLPCIKKGCMTTCYFQGSQSSSQALSQPCTNCNNPNQQGKVYLDVGFKMFLHRHRQYILINKPLSVQINPVKHEFVFTTGLRNNLLSKLSAHIGGKIFDDLRLGQMVAVNSQVLDFPRLNQQLQTVMTPVVKRRRYLLYNFCKYVPLPSEDKTQLYILLFLFGLKEPKKTRILLQGKPQICSQQIFLRDVMISFLGQLNTLIFAIPLPGVTEYYVAHIGQHYSRQEGVLRVIAMKEWRDPLGRYNGSVVVDQKTSSIFVIGGHDIHRNDSLEYVSCFLKCRWQEGQKWVLKADIQKSHHMFRGRLGNSSSGMFNSSFKNPYNQSKIAFRNASFMIYSYDREYAQQLNTNFVNGLQKMRKEFFNVGGGLKDSSVFATGRFSTKRPGIRYLKYNTNSDQNPILNQTDKGELNFSGNNYILIQLPYLDIPNKKKYRHHCIVMGGHKDPQERSKEVTDFSKIYYMNIQKLEQTVTLTQKFKLSAWLPERIDQFTALLKESKTGNFYLRATFPLKRPLQLSKDCYVHYIALEFDLSTGLFSFLPGIVGI